MPDTIDAADKADSRQAHNAARDMFGPQYAERLAPLRRALLRKAAKAGAGVKCTAMDAFEALAGTGRPGIGFAMLLAASIGEECEDKTNA